MSERTSHLIVTVKSYPVLYDPSHEHFRNKRLKNSIWEEIALIVGESNGETVKSKFRNLRDCYSKHLRSKSISGPISRHTARYKSWPWVQDMSFLEPYMEIGTQNMPNGNDSENNNTNSESQSYQHQTDKVNNKSRNSKKSRDPEFHYDKVLDFLNNSSSTDFDGTDLVFLGHSRIVKKFSPYRQALVKYKIAKIIMEAELENLKEMGPSSSNINSTEFERGDSPIEFIDPPEVKLETLGGNNPLDFDP